MVAVVTEVITALLASFWAAAPRGTMTYGITKALRKGRGLIIVTSVVAGVDNVRRVEKNDTNANMLVGFICTKLHNE